MGVDELNGTEADAAGLPEDGTAPLTAGPQVLCAADLAANGGRQEVAFIDTSIPLCQNSCHTLKPQMICN